MKMPEFIVGYNEAWFGQRFGSDLTTEFDLPFINKTFDGIVKAGGQVVRVELFLARQGIQLSPDEMSIEGVSPSMLVNIGKMLDSARARGLWVYVTALEANTMPTDGGPLRDYYFNLLNNKFGQGDAFQSKVLAPVLAVLDAHKDVIYGFDIVNEIQAARAHSYWPDPVQGPRGFMQRTTAFIKSKSPWLRVTTTAGWEHSQYDISLGLFSGLGLDFYDLHVYSDDGTYPGASDVCAKAAADGVPIILGEFGQLKHVNDDNLQVKAAQRFLSDAKSLCFKGALAWRYDATEAWWNFERSDGSFRPAVGVIQWFATH